MDKFTHEGQELYNGNRGQAGKPGNSNPRNLGEGVWHELERRVKE